jgi:uncharacterized lipoprotein NlpE involved in copper resistance
MPIFKLNISQSLADSILTGDTLTVLDNDGNEINIDVNTEEELDLEGDESEEEE